MPRPVVIEMFFRHFAAIDIHDHLRQGLLQIERAWKTNTWEHRIFGTMLGIIVTNAFLLYRYERKGADLAHMTYFEFVDVLVDQLIHSSDGVEGMMLRPRAAAVVVQQPQLPDLARYFHRFLTLF